MKQTREITSRLASPVDANIIHGMLLRLAASTDSTAKISSSLQDIESALSGSAPDINAIVAEIAGEAVGMSVFFLTYSTWRGARGVYIQDIFVANEARGMGLGARLLREVISWAMEQGADHLRLSVDRDNAAAQSFYENVGLSFRDDEKIYTIIGDSFADLGSGS